MTCSDAEVDDPQDCDQPTSLRRGATVAVTRGSWLLLAMLAAASRAGSWCGVVGWPEFGGLAAAEVGVALERVVAVPEPGGQWFAATTLDAGAGHLPDRKLTVTVP